MAGCNYTDQLQELMVGKPNGEGAAHHEGLNYAHIPNPKTRYSGDNSDGDYATRRGVDQQRGPVVSSVYDKALYR